MKILLILYLILNVASANAQDAEFVSVINNDPSFNQVLFRSGDKIYLQVLSDSSKLLISSDLIPSNRKKEIIYFSSKNAKDSLFIGTIPAGGLYMMKASVAKRGSDYNYFELIPMNEWERLWYIHFQMIRSKYYGYKWKIGSEDSIMTTVYKYVYCYSPGVIFDKTLLSSELSIEPAKDTAGNLIRSFSHSIHTALNSVNLDSVNIRIDRIINNLENDIDSSTLCRFSFYLPKQDSVRLLVTVDSGYLNNSQKYCKQILQALLDILSDTAVSNIKSDTDPAIKIAAITSPQKDVLKIIADSVFLHSPNSFFKRYDENIIETNLNYFKSVFDPASSAIFCGVANKNFSDQLMIVANIIGKKVKKSAQLKPALPPKP